MVNIAGYTRLKTALKSGLTFIPVFVANDLNEDQTNTLHLADNKTAETAK